MASRSAIELAASRMQSMTTTELRDRLDDRFRLLVGARRGLERHQTLRHAVQWSYDLLDKSEKALLARCSVFAGGFDLAAACAIADSGDEYATLDLLDALVRKSLVVADSASDRTRFSMLETIRQFAEEQLVGSGEADQTRTAHARYFAGRETDVLALWDGPRQREAYTWFTIELSNLRTAFRWGADHGDLATAATVSVYAAFLGIWVEQYEPIGWAEELIESARAVDHPRLAQVYAMAAQCYTAGRIEDFLSYAEASQLVTTSGSFDQFPYEFEAAHGVGYAIAGQPERWVALCRTIIARGAAAASYARSCLVVALALVGAGEEAFAAGEGLLAAADATANPNVISFARLAYSFACHDTDPATEYDVLQRGLTIAQNTGNRQVESNLAVNLARRAATHGDPKRRIRLPDAGDPPPLRLRQLHHHAQLTGNAGRILRPARHSRTGRHHKRIRCNAPFADSVPRDHHCDRTFARSSRRRCVRRTRPPWRKHDQRSHGGIRFRPDRPCPRRDTPVTAPSGVVTFLFTDIEGSTRRWEADPEGMRAALAAHDEVLRQAITGHGGSSFKHTGDGVCAAFGSPRGAVDAAIAAQRALELPVRMGIATGEAELRDGDYFGAVLNRASRLMAAGHGGQILLDGQTAGLMTGVDLIALGPKRLRDLAQPVDVFQVGGSGMTTEFPPLRTLDRAPGNLRSQTTSFIGRESEVAGVRAAVDANRLVTLTGVGGVGKTRLALEVAAQSVSSFADGVWLIELAAVGDPGAVPDAVAATLGITQQAGMTISDSVAAALEGRSRLLGVRQLRTRLGRCRRADRWNLRSVDDGEDTRHQPRGPASRGRTALARNVARHRIERGSTVRRACRAGGTRPDSSHWR